MRQGDIAVCEFHQLRARSGGERRGPAGEEVSKPNLPYFGPHRDYEVPVDYPGGKRVVRVLRVWIGHVIVLHQSCEFEYADEDDSRCIVAPLAFETEWTDAAWDAIRKRRVPGFTWLPALDSEAAVALGIEGPLPEAAVCHASATALSIGVVQSRRSLSLGPEKLLELQEDMVRFGSVRGWASTRELDTLAGKTIVEARETVEMVPGPARLAKIVLRDDADTDEITVAWGLRPRSG
jgi:hypothetical protein